MWSGIWSMVTTWISFWTWLWSTRHCGRRQKVACWFAGKTRLVSFDWSNNTGSIDVKIDESVLEEKSYFKMLGLTFSSKLDCCSYIISIAKTASQKIGTLIRSMKFFSPEVAIYFYKSTIHPYMEYCCHVAAGAPNCYSESLASYKNEYAGLCVLHLLLLMNPWPFIEMWLA